MSLLSEIVSSLVHAAAMTTGPAPGQPPSGQPPSGSATSQSAPVSGIDIGHVLATLAGQRGEQLDWQSSIVDLLKTLGLDSSHEARTRMATDLGYQGNPRDSAAMNEWLHGQVIEHLEKNGGKVGDELKNPK